MKADEEKRLMVCPECGQVHYGTSYPVICGRPCCLACGVRLEEVRIRASGVG